SRNTRYFTPNSLLASSIFSTSGSVSVSNAIRNSRRVSYQNTMRCLSNRLVSASWIRLLLMSVLVLCGQARNLLQCPLELEVIHLHPVIQVNLHLLGGQRVEHVALVVF